MTSFAPSRSRRLAAAASALTVIAVAVGVLVLALGVSLPEAWWPRTGQAFAADAAKAPADPCDRIAGPAKAYCERGRHATSAQAGGDAAAWKLLSAATAIGALVIWRRRAHTRQGRA
ncbi:MULTISPECIES: hypothetical protein [Streptomyces]|uniref:Secreted protein n=2 Tax=Streptomyces avermitilis TaxID=33903 RepID=Q82RG7_STRAW|nr:MULTISPECIES: hypothetical protein [Streptomyces]MYS95887.1 hypothetical protein [Streptomyces sp. SID5469]BAC67885.1 putative secreted protein [Streptomyces avermitilis MA-4680 = NBRC 14893]GDY70043.1 hypothetical protein SAV14893_094360 [Streptomyces avermitilis]GDY80320.1 hypothetical protein SAV31267_098050 [Streptomyces avermitilis]